MLSRIVAKTTNIRSNHRDLINTRESQYPRDGNAVMFPQAQIVAEPLAHMLSGASKRRSRDHEGSFARATIEEGIVRCHRHHLAVDIMRVVLDQAICMF
jgi:hypothetical protein